MVQIVTKQKLKKMFAFLINHFLVTQLDCAISDEINVLVKQIGIERIVTWKNL